MSREERKSGWKLFLSIKSVKMLIYFLKSLVEINPCDIYNTHTLPGLKYHWSCKCEGQWREMIGMGRKKKFNIFTKHSPPQRGWSGFQRLLLSLYFFLMQWYWVESTDSHTPPAVRKHGFIGKLFLWAVQWKTRTIWSSRVVTLQLPWKEMLLFFFFLIICCVSQPLF